MKGSSRWMPAVLMGLLLALVAIGPVVWLAIVSLQPADADLLSLRVSFSWGAFFEHLADGRVGTAFEALLPNYHGAWTEGGLARPLLNSVIVTASQAVLNVLLASLAAFPLALMRFRGRGVLFAAVLATMMIPEQVIIVPMFRTIVAMNLYDTLVAIVLPFSVNAFGIFLCRQAFLAIPTELCDAACVDGANAMQSWRHVMLPLIAPTLATLALFSVVGAWSNLLWPLLVVQSAPVETLPIAVNRLLGAFATNVRFAYAGSVLALIPIVLFFVASQRWFKPEIFSGAVKA